MPQPDTLDPRILGQRIAEARKARGKTQEELAEFLGCSRPTYIAIEKGDRLAKTEEILKLAPFLGKKVNDLVRPTEPVVDLQPHLRAVAERMKGTDEAALQAAIADLQQLAEDYRELERMMNAPLRFNYPPEVSLDTRIDSAELAEGVGRPGTAAAGSGRSAGHRPPQHAGVGCRTSDLLQRCVALGDCGDVRLHRRPRLLHPRQPQAPT